MHTEEEAQRIARKIHGTWMISPNPTEFEEGYGRRIARVGSHITNGVKRYAVHVTCVDGAFTPYTVS